MRRLLLSSVVAASVVGCASQATLNDLNDAKAACRGQSGSLKFDLLRAAQGQ